MPLLLRLITRRATAVVLVSAAFVLADMPSGGVASASAASFGIPSLAAPATAVEGASFAVTASIPRPRTATTVVLQFHDRHDYDFQSTLTWTKKTSQRVQGRSKVIFHLRADQAHEAWYRAVVAYRGTTTKATSTARRVNYLH